jgi:hypothetical protein
VILSSNKEGQINFSVIYHQTNKTFMASDSCGARKRRVTEYALTSQMKKLKTIKTTHVSAVYGQFVSCFGLFDIAG